MQINIAAAGQNAIQSYSDQEVQINSVSYARSLIVSREEIITDVAIKSILEVDEQYIQLLLNLNPELIIIGHQQTGQFLPLDKIMQLQQQRIGIECMSLGAACRTYNILLSEGRAVVAGLIIDECSSRRLG
jgi:uncharacterized protein